MTTSIQMRPLSDHTWLRPEVKRSRSQFSALWSQTKHQLLTEVDQLKGGNLVIELDVRETHINKSGSLRHDAKVHSPAVIVAFDTKAYGPMLYRADSFTTGRQGAWQHNVRAVALTLQMLRTVERYGAVNTGQQYTGFLGLPAPKVTPAQDEHMKFTDARKFIMQYSPMAGSLEQAYRQAVAILHPDKGGSEELFHKLQNAAKATGLR